MWQGIVDIAPSVRNLVRAIGSQGQMLPTYDVKKVKKVVKAWA